MDPQHTRTYWIDRLGAATRDADTLHRLGKLPDDEWKAARAEDTARVAVDAAGLDWDTLNGAVRAHLLDQAHWLDAHDFSRWLRLLTLTRNAAHAEWSTASRIA